MEVEIDDAKPDNQTLKGSCMILCSFGHFYRIFLGYISWDHLKSLKSSSRYFCMGSGGRRSFWMILDDFDSGCELVLRKVCEVFAIPIG